MNGTNESEFRFRQLDSLADYNMTSYGDASDTTNVRELRVDQLLMIYVLPVIIVAGVVGNMASAIVLFRSRMRTVSVYLYLLLLAFADTLVLFTSAFKTWFRLVADIEWLHASNVACRTLTFLFVASLHMSAWLVVLTTADRFIAVWFPLKTVTFCSNHRARLAAGLLLLATVVFDGHLFWTVRLQYSEPMDDFAEPPRPRCQPDPDVGPFMYGPFEYLKVATYNVIPFVIIATLNVAIIAKLRLKTAPSQQLGQARGRDDVINDGVFKTTYCCCYDYCCYCCCCCPRTDETNCANPIGVNSASSGGQQCDIILQSFHIENGNDSAWLGQSIDYDSSANYRLSGHSAFNNEVVLRRHADESSGTGHAQIQSRVTTMLLTVSFVWLALTTPFAVCSFLFTVADLSPQTALLLMPFKAVAFLLLYANHAVNFYLYCLTGRKFRRELLETISTTRDWCTGKRRGKPSCMGCLPVTDRGAAAKRGRRSTTIEMTSRSEMASRLVSIRKSEV